uniref:Uncharacterized protein n=1 Tax=Arion vulgaris TaxID=1028688 RepID=A0A0B6YPD5_9EUPU
MVCHLIHCVLDPIHCVLDPKLYAEDYRIKQKSRQFSQVQQVNIDVSINRP